MKAEGIKPYPFFGSGDGYTSPSGCLVDMHSHILPKLDDGSQSVEMSLEMIDISVKQGVSVICLTPHFYPSTNRPESFFRHRQSAWERLSESFQHPYPRLLLGAEVQYFDGLSHMTEIEKFCIGESGTLLLEMPFQPWSRRMVADVIEMQTYSGMQILLAHIERYLSFMERGMLEDLLSAGVMIQTNAEPYLGLLSAGKLLRMIDYGMVHVLGSDAHNTGSRKPKLGYAACKIADKLDPRAVMQLTRNAEMLLGIGENAPRSQDINHI